MHLMTLHPWQVTFPGKSGPNFLASGEGANDASLEIRSEPLVGHFRVTSNSLWEGGPQISQRVHKSQMHRECFAPLEDHCEGAGRCQNALSEMAVEY